MTDYTIDFIRETRRAVVGMSDGTAEFFVWLGAFVIALASGFFASQFLATEYAFASGIGSGLSFVAWAFPFVGG